MEEESAAVTNFSHVVYGEKLLQYITGMETLPVLSRLESFTYTSMWKPQYTYKMWLGALCIIVFGGDLGTCIRSLNEDMSMKILSSQPAADGWSPPASAKVQFSDNNTLDGLEIQSKFDGEVSCQRRDLKITSDVTRYLPNGVPIYHIEIANTCIYCSLTNIRVGCGAWASQTMVNPDLFRRVSENDCVVNNGNALDAQDMVFFEYSNSFPYPMDVRSVKPVCK